VYHAHNLQPVLSDGYDTATAQEQQPLSAGMSAALVSFERGEMAAALNQLCAFPHKVRAQLAPGIPALANEFTAVSQKISDGVSGHSVN
jgi:hypothetical protein